MAKLNSIGVRAKDIDRIFANAIRWIAEGKQEFSCCAIAEGINFGGDKLKVRKFYERVLTTRTNRKMSDDWNLLVWVTKCVGLENTDKSQGFRILMLSLIKAAWRDLI